MMAKPQTSINGSRSAIIMSPIFTLWPLHCWGCYQSLEQEFVKSLPLSLPLRVCVCVCMQTALSIYNTQMDLGFIHWRQKRGACILYEGQWSPEFPVCCRRDKNAAGDVVHYFCIQFRWIRNTNASIDVETIKHSLNYCWISGVSEN